MEALNHVYVFTGILDTSKLIRQIYYETFLFGSS